MKTTIKKSIVLLMMALGFIVMVAESDGGLTTTLIIKGVGICLICAGIHLCAHWHLFQDFIDND